MAIKKNISVLTPYNPLAKRHLGEQVAEALLSEPIHTMPPERFIGAGVYALYYIGDFPAYAALAEVNRDDQYLNTICSPLLLRKNSLKSVPRHWRISCRVAMEGEVRSLSSWEMNPFDSSVRFASSSWVSPFCTRRSLIFFPISINYGPVSRLMADADRPLPAFVLSL